MRTPITLKIKFKSSSLDQFIERYSVDVSRGGIFIRTKEPLPVGTTLRFEFQLQDSSSLIGGEGTVVWNRAYDPARTGVAPGMGVRFDKLTADSQRVLERILSEKHKRGEAQLESRFDAGVRATREARSSHEFADAGTPLPAPVPGMGMSSSPGLGPSSRPGGGDGFGDEPTRMMAAEQMNQLAADMQNEDFAQDQPTRRATLDEIRRAVSATEQTGAQRSGTTGEQPRPRVAVSQTLPRGMAASAASGSASKMTAAMGVVDPRLAAGAQPTSSSQDFPMPPSLSTRPVSDAEAAALIAASASAHTPPAQIVPPPEAHGDRTPPRSLLPEMPATPKTGATPPRPPPDEVVSSARPTLVDAAAQAATLVDAPVPPLPAGGNGVLQTISTPPPPESADFLSTAHAQTQPAGPAPEGAPSGISIGLDFDSVTEANGPAPLDPGAFGPISSSPPPTAREGKAEPEPHRGEPARSDAPKVETTTGKVKVSAPVSPPPDRRGTWRTAVQVVVLLGAVVLAGAGIYALLGKTPAGDPQPKPQPSDQPVPKPTPPVPEKVTPPPEKPPEGDKGQKGEPEKTTPGPEKAGPGQTPEKAAGPDKGQKGEIRPGTEPTRRPDKPEGEVKKPVAAPDKAQGTGLSITSEPTGARVELNGKAVGETPLQTTDVQPGKTYDIRLSLRGYQDAKFKLKAVQGEGVAKSTKLTPYERVVEVNSSPRGAEVFVDGKRAGRTPITLKRLDMSKIHEIEVRKTGYAPQTAKVADTDTFDVKGGREVRTLNLTLEAQPGQAPPRAEPPRHENKRPAVKDGGEGKGEQKSEGKGEQKSEGKGEKPERPEKAEKPEARPEPKPEKVEKPEPKPEKVEKPEEAAPEGPR